MQLKLITIFTSIVAYGLPVQALEVSLAAHNASYVPSYYEGQGALTRVNWPLY